MHQLPSLSPDLLEAVYEHAEAGHPEEVCGLLRGPPGSLDEVRRCENRQNALHAEDPLRHPRDARTAYRLGLADLFVLEKSLASARPVQAVYHSHVETGAHFSSDDAAGALHRGQPLYPVDHVVIDVKRGQARGLAWYRFDADRAAFVEIARWERDR